MSAKKEMQQIDQFHQARMMSEQAMRMTQALNAAANDDREVIEEEDTGILKELFADVQDKGFVLSKSWGELLCSLSKYQGKLMVTENSYVERERKIKQQEQKLKQQTQSWPEEVLQLQSALSRKEKTLAACQAELVHVNKMAELVDAEHNGTKEILENVLREKSEVEEKCAQYEIDLNSMSQKLQASQEELEIKDQLVVKLEQQMVKEIADSMQEMTSLKGLLESREELLEDEKKAHDETNIKLRQLQISYQALKRNLDSSSEYLQRMPMMPYHDRMMSPHQMGDMAYYTTPGPSNTQLWRPVPMRSDASCSGGPPSKVRRVVTSSSTTEMFHLDDIMPQFPLHHGLFDFDSSVNMNNVDLPLSPRPGPRQEGRGHSLPENNAQREGERRISAISDNNLSENQDSDDFNSDMTEINNFSQRKSTDANINATSSILEDVRSRVAAFKERLKQKRSEVFGKKSVAVDNNISGSENNSSNTLLSRPGTRKRPLAQVGDLTIDVDQPRATRGLQTKKTTARSPPLVASSSNQIVPYTGTKSPVKSCSVILSRVKMEKLSPNKSDTASPQHSSRQSNVIESLGKKAVGSSSSGGKAHGAGVARKTCKATKCSICRISLPSMAMYIVHAKKEHPGVDVFKCWDCNKVFTGPYGLNHHVKLKQCQL